MASNSPEMASDTKPSEYDTARASKFKFKSKTKRRRYEEDDAVDRRSKRPRSEPSEEGERKFSKPHTHKERKRKHASPLQDDPTAYDSTYEANNAAGAYANPDHAFRESLFDAMADDEGAAFWEGVYGQPIHVYPHPTQAGEDGSGKGKAELDGLNDEEYAEYVRARMWERTHQHVMEERAKREERRKKRKEEEEDWGRSEEGRKERADKEMKERYRFESKIEKSLRRGEERKSQKRWRDAWTLYIQGWSRFTEILAVKSKEAGSLEGKAARGIIPWPVESGKYKHVGKEEVESFFEKAVPTDTERMAIMKAERVRWHPDKMQQRFGGNKLDDESMGKVTAVFQVVDRLWGELREKR